MTTPRQHYPVGPWWDTLLWSWESLQCLAEINGWRDVGTSLNKENSYQAMENIPLVGSQPLEILNTCLVRT